MNTKRILCILLGTLLFTAQAQAIQISAAGDSWTVDWRKQGNWYNRLPGDLTATSQWIVRSYSSNRIVLDITVSNTTASPGLMTYSDIQAFAIMARPGMYASLLSPGNVFDKAAPFWRLQVIKPAKPYSTGGLTPGQTDTLQLMLSGNFGKSTGLGLFLMKFKSRYGYYLTKGVVGKPVNIPEPPVVFLLLAGLAGIALTRRLRTRPAMTV